MSSPKATERVIIVDDEEMVLTSLNAYLGLETEWEVKTFTSAKAALEYINANEIDVVVSDYLMPEMDGITFLSGVRALRPEVPRIILTGYADKENAIKGINDVGLYQYIEKPWDNDAFRIVLRNAIEKHQLMSRLQSKIDEFNKAYSELQGIQHQILKTFV